MAGYSGTPLPKKLGIKPDDRVALVGAPPSLRRALGKLPAGVTLHEGLRARRTFDVILFFTQKHAELERRFAPLARRLERSGGLWIAWPKRSFATDLSGAEVRATGLAGGLVDNKVCAVDETWSGLRFVYRLRDC